MEAPGTGFTVCSFKCCVWTSSEWHVILLQHSSCPVCPTSCPLSQWEAYPRVGWGYSPSSGLWLSPGSGKSTTEHPPPHSGALLAPTTLLKVGTSNSGLPWQVHGSFSASIIDKQWWEEVRALSCGRTVAKHLYSLQAGQVCQQSPCMQKRQLIYRKTGLKSSKGCLKAG